MGLKDGGSSGITIVMFLSVDAAAGGSPVSLPFDVVEVPAPPQAVKTRLVMMIGIRKNNERVLVNIGPPESFFYHTGVLLHVLPVMLRSWLGDFWVNWVQ
jgi:hypothetical protein